jgi:arylsulfate sulfotransferase
MNRRISVVQILVILRAFGFVLGLLGAAALTGCQGDSSSSTPPPTFTAEPVLTLSTNPDTPLAATLELFTNVVPSRVTLTISDGTNSWSLKYKGFSINHTLPVRGLHPGKTHTFQVTVANSSGSTTKELSETLTTDPLPTDFPVLNISIYDATRLEPGFTLFAPFGQPAYIIAIDKFGEVAWFLRFTESSVADLRLLANGHLLFNQSGCRIFEVDLDGNVVTSWNTKNMTSPTTSCAGSVLDGSINVPIEATHHEVSKMPSGNLLTLSWNNISVDNYPLSDTDPTAGTGTQPIREDVLAEFQPNGKTIVRQYHLYDIIDPTRIGYNSVDSAGGVNDWTHSNGLIYDSSDNSYIVSSRHQDAVTKINRDTGDIVWILGNPSGWNSPFDQYLLTATNFSGQDYFWHQHAPEITPDGTLMLYDNGNFRARPYDTKLAATSNYSRAVEYSIDTQNREVTQVWEYGSPETAVGGVNYTPFIGDADVQPETDNVLITFGGITRDVSTGAATDGIRGAALNARIVEVTHTRAPEKLLEIYCGTPDHTDDNNCTIYRSEHIPSLIPEYQ